MALYQPIGDSFTIAKFAYDLYSKGFVVARHAPEDFRVLLKDMDAIKNVLGHIQSQLSDGEEFDERTKETLRLCYHSLQSFKPLLNRYEKLAYSDRGLWPRRFQWASDQENLKKYKLNLDHHLQMLQSLQLVLIARRRGTVVESRTPDANIGVSPKPSLATPQGSGQVEHVEYAQVNPKEVQENRGSPSISWNMPQLDIRRWLRDWKWFPSSSKPGLDLGASARSTTTTVESIMEYLDARREIHGVTKAVDQEFERAYDTVEEQTDLESWIRLSTWWLLKSKVVRKALRSGFGDQWQQENIVPWTAVDEAVSEAQAAADLLKSSWIFEEVILGDRYSQSEIGDPTWRILRTLSTSIHKELRDLRVIAQGSSLDDEETILRQDLSFIETFIQPVEESKRIPAAFDTLRNPHRWLAPDIDYAGAEQEKCLLQTFVNAQIGSKKVRMKSCGAPYLLLLWCQQGKSEIIVSLFNQHNTINLSRILTPDDLKFSEGSPLAWEGLQIDFPSQTTFVQFLSPKDQDAFLGFAQEYFAQIKNRDPRPGEILTFRESLQFYELRGPSLGSGVKCRGQARKSCEVSLYDLIPDKCWKLSRRLVISASPAASKRWCISHWLPSSRVRVQQDDRQVRLMWSDCDHLEQKTDGFYVSNWSYLYKPDQSNRVIDLVFEDRTTAEALVDSILDPFNSPFQTPFVKEIAHFESSAASQKAIVYELSDLDDTGREGYHAVVSINKRPNTNFVSDVYLIYRDFDFVLEDDENFTVMFPQLRAPHYISNKIKMITKPSESSEAPKVEDVTTVPRDAIFHFNNKFDRADFLKHVTGGWQLVFCHLTLAVHLKAHHRLFSKSHENAVIQLWERKVSGQPTRHIFAMRSAHVPGLKWTTCLFSDTQYFKDSVHGSKLVLTHLVLRQGVQIDSNEMKAIGLALPSPQEPRRKWRATIIFKHDEERQEFIKQVEPVLQGWPTRIFPDVEATVASRALHN